MFKGDCLVLGLWFEGLELGRQAAWRPGIIGMAVVTIGGGTVQAVAVFKGDCLVLGLWFEGLELGRQAAWRPGIIGMVSSQLVAALCKQLPCLKVTAWFLGSGLRGLNSVVKLLGGRVYSEWCRHNWWRHCASSCRV